MTTNAQVAENLSDTVRVAYYRRRAMHLRILRSLTTNESDLTPEDKLPYIPAWDGGQDSRGRNCKAIWPSLARFASEEQLDVWAWTDALFSLAYLFDHVPRPTDLKQSDVLRMTYNWKERQALSQHALAVSEFNGILRELWQRKQYSMATSEAQARTVILDPRIEASPVIRYSIACSYKQDDLAAILEPAAISQYRTDPQMYADVMGPMFPERLKINSDKLEEEAQS